MRHLLAALALWIMGSSPPLHAEALLTCPCHAKGYPRCDCGEGCLCRCIRLQSGTPLPIAAQFALAMIPKTLSGIYHTHRHDESVVTVIVTPLRDSNHFHVLWYYHGELRYRGILKRTGPFTAVESWWESAGHVHSEGPWMIFRDGARLHSFDARREH